MTLHTTSAIFDHPCDRYSCPEWNQGQCFGGGCRRNPARRDEREDADERELNDEWMGEEEEQCK